MADKESTTTVPAVFISHGSPMVAIERGEFQQSLAAFGERLRPLAIVVISAHWGSSASIAISSAKRYEAVHDFGGFPHALYELTYSPPGSPELALRMAEQLQQAGWAAELVDNDRIDHGVWIPLRLMYPAADIPIVQLSVPLRFTPRQLVEVGQVLKPLRSENILIVGSGGIVHNLRLFRGGEINPPVEPWAKEFDDWFAARLEEGDVGSLLRFEELAPQVRLAVPTFEHLAPVFIVLGAVDGYKEVRPIFEGFQYGTISMRSFAIA
jgi:4,5-DOPA dioxygenase extradiol